MNRPQRERRQVERFRAHNNNNNNVVQQPAQPRVRAARRAPEPVPEPEPEPVQEPPRRGRRRAQPQQDEGRTLDLTLTKYEYGYHNIFDPEAYFYTEAGYFIDPNDDIKRRFDELDFSRFEGVKTIRGLANYEIPNIDSMEINTVSFQRFKDGEYQKGRSNSDARAAERIKSFTSKLQSFQQYKNQDSLDWIVRKHRLLYCEILEHSFKKRLSPSTIEAELYAILRVFTAAIGDTHVLYMKYNAIYLELRDFIRTKENNNELNEVELSKGGLIPWEMVLKRQQELYRAFKAVTNKQTKEAYILAQDLLLLSLYSLIPPLRGEVKSLEYADNPDTFWADRSGNLILFEDDDIYLELHEVKKRHGYIKLDLPNDLKEIIREDYTQYPRKYAFTETKKFPPIDRDVKEQTVANRLKNLFANTGYDVGSSMLRSSYVTYWFSKVPRINYNKKLDIARRMRTSIKMLDGNYNKILHENNPNEVLQPIAEQRVVQGGQNETVIVLNRQRKNGNKDDTYQKHLERQREYYENNKQEIQAKQKVYRDANKPKENKRKVLYYLNNDPDYANRIKPSTMQKYNIKLQNGKYI